MERIRFAIMFILAAIMAAACNDDIFPAFVADDSIHLEVNGVTQLRYDETDCQLGYNRERGQFRMCTDRMSDYFSIKMNSLPSNQGDMITADLVWTTKTDVITRKNVALEVVKAEGDKFWLWNEQGRIALVIQLLD